VTPAPLPPSLSPEPLLPMEPALNDPVQAALTAAHLADPEALAAYFRRLRAALDPELRDRFPTFAGKAYPLGRCREIRDAVFAALEDRIRRPRDAADSALAAFLTGGGAARKIWGVLRDTYFQNAIQLGAWYVDVANDTVVASKPPVEILPIAAADMMAVRDYAHFAAIASIYWDVTVYRNSVFPRLAAIFPLVCVNAGGAAWLAAASDQVVELTRRERFRPSLDALARFPDPPEESVAVLRRLAGREGLAMLAAGGDPVAEVERCVAEGGYADLAYRQRCVDAYRRLRAATPSG